MTAPTIVTHGEAASLIGLIRAVRELDIEIPADVEAERKIHRDLADAKRVAQQSYDAALARLRTVPADDFDQARDAAVDVSLRMFATQQGMDSILAHASTARLQSVVYTAISSWERAVVAQFNEVVESHRLNELAPDLPNLSDPGSFHIMAMGQAQGHALEAWRTAAVHLRPRWDLYKRLAHFNGHVVGPADASDLATNLWTACALGDPGDFGRTQAAAVTMASMAFGSDSTRPWEPVVPFIVPALHGYALRLSTVGNAAMIRSRVQHG